MLLNTLNTRNVVLQKTKFYSTNDKERENQMRSTRFPFPRTKSFVLVPFTFLFVLTVCLSLSVPSAHAQTPNDWNGEKALLWSREQHGAQCEASKPCITEIWQIGDELYVRWHDNGNPNDKYLFSDDGGQTQSDIGDPREFYDHSVIFQGETSRNYSVQLDGCNSKWYDHSCSDWTKPIHVTVRATAIQIKAAQLPWIGNVVGPTNGRVPFEKELERGGFSQDYQNASIYWTPTFGAHEINGFIRDKWSAKGREQSFLGYPIGDELDTRVRTDGQTGRYSAFENGVIYWEKGYEEAFAMDKGFYLHWAKLDYEQGPLGYPTGDQWPSGTTTWTVSFEKGRMDASQQGQTWTFTATINGISQKLP